MDDTGDDNDVADGGRVTDGGGSPDGGNTADDDVSVNGDVPANDDVSADDVTDGTGAAGSDDLTAGGSAVGGGADGVTGIFARESSYLDRYVQLGIASGRVLSVSFPETPDEQAEDDHELLDRIFDYLDGLEEDDFADVEVALTVPTDQRNVLERVRQIPFGDQINVETLTRMTSGLDHTDDDDLDVVRTALDQNPAPLIIPDHRVRDGPSAAPAPVEQKLRSLEGL